MGQYPKKPRTKSAKTSTTVKAATPAKATPKRGTMTFTTSVFGGDGLHKKVKARAGSTVGELRSQLGIRSDLIVGINGKKVLDSTVVESGDFMVAMPAGKGGN